VSRARLFTRLLLAMTTPLRFAETLLATVLFGLIIVLARAPAVEDGKGSVVKKRRPSSDGVATRKEAACGDAAPLSGDGVSLHTITVYERKRA
jgi:hypothetical protein